MNDQPLRRDNLWGQGMRFAIAGVVVAMVYIGITTVLAATTQLPFQVGLAIGWCVAVVVHFTLQRLFVWTHEAGFALPFRHQVGRYLLVAGSQFGVTAIGTAVLPSLLGLSAETIYLAMAAIITVANFLVFRYGVFHSDASGGARQA
jgi:putative flippase GtrA